MLPAAAKMLTMPSTPTDWPVQASKRKKPVKVQPVVAHKSRREMLFTRSRLGFDQLAAAVNLPPPPLGHHMPKTT